MLQPPYSPNLAPSDIFLFQKVKHHFESTDHIQRLGLKGYPTKCVPGMLQTIAAPMEKVCAGTKDVI
jgi:hypothetical protein